MDDLTTIVTVLLTLSLASERLVEILKSFFFTSLLKKKEGAEEAARQAKIQGLAVISGLITAGLAAPVLVKDFEFHYIWAIPVLGLLASGGSGLWNSVLGYLKGVKDLRQCEAEEQRMEVTEEKQKPKAA